MLYGFAMKLAALLLLVAQEGPHLPMKAEEAARLTGFEKGRRVVAARVRIDFKEDDPLAHHPPKGVTLSGAAWLRKELTDMVAAHIDVALIEYRSAPAVKALVEALEAMDRDKLETPKIGVFLDKADPATMRDLFSLVPPRFWAMVEGRPLVRVVTDAKGVAALQARMKEELAGHEGALIGAEAIVVTPGVIREKGTLYQRSWHIAAEEKPTFVVVESWNDYGAATEIGESKEHGREYIDATARFADRVRKGEPIPNPGGAYSKAPKVIWNLKVEPNEAGLKPVEVEEGPFDVAELTGIRMLTTKQAGKEETRRVHFAVDDTFRFHEKRGYAIDVEFLDKGRGTFTLEYDSADATKSGAERWCKQGGEEPFTDSGEWKFATFRVNDALFGNRQPGGADFRLVVKKRGLTIRRVSVTPQ